jgi:hypothetical protein
VHLTSSSRLLRGCTETTTETQARIVQLLHDVHNFHLLLQKKTQAAGKQHIQQSVLLKPPLSSEVIKEHTINMLNKVQSRGPAKRIYSPCHYCHGLQPRLVYLAQVHALPVLVIVLNVDDAGKANSKLRIITGRESAQA